MTFDQTHVVPRHELEFRRMRNTIESDLSSLESLRKTVVGHIEELRKDFPSNPDALRLIENLYILDKKLGDLGVEARRLQGVTHRARNYCQNDS